MPVILAHDCDIGDIDEQELFKLAYLGGVVGVLCWKYREEFDHLEINKIFVE